MYHAQTLTRYLDIVQSILVHRIRWPLPFQLEYHQPTIMTWGEGGGGYRTMNTETCVSTTASAIKSSCFVQ